MWFLLAIVAYFLFSAVVILDKYFLGKPIPNPKIYLFYTSLASILFVVLVPFGLDIPPPAVIVLNFLAAGTFVVSLYALYVSFKFEEASKVISSVGGFTAAFIYILNYLIFNKTNIWKQISNLEINSEIPIDSLKILGLIFLIFGAFFILISFNKTMKKTTAVGPRKIAASINPKILMSVLAASSSSTLFFFFIKLVYSSQSFISGFIWVKLGIIFFGSFFLFSKEVRKLIKPVFKSLNCRRGASFSGTTIFISKLAVGGAANVIQHFATALAPLKNVSLVKALEGTEYAFVLASAYFLSKRYPKILKEKVETDILAHKILSVLIIAGGIIILNI